MNTGNASLAVVTELSRMRKGKGTDVSYVSGQFSVTLTERSASGVDASQTVLGLKGGRDLDAADPFLGADQAVLDEVCIAPGQTGRLDFALNPDKPLRDGFYAGKVRLNVQSSAGCASRP